MSRRTWRQIKQGLPKSKQGIFFLFWFSFLFSFVFVSVVFYDTGVGLPLLYDYEILEEGELGMFPFKNNLCSDWWAGGFIR